MTLLVNSVCSFQSIVVGLNRSDYMVDQKEDGTSSLKQVEINTIAAAGFGVTDCLPVVHRYLRKSRNVFISSQTQFNQVNVMLIILCMNLLR